MKDVLKAFRDALVADATLVALIPTSNIYAGLRDEKTPIPAVDVFLIPGTTEPYAGARVGGITQAMEVVQISVFHHTEPGALTIADMVVQIILSDNTTLNTAGIKKPTMIATPASFREANISHVPLRFRYSYHFTTS